MTIHALEAGDPLTVTEVRKYPTAHQRCGTEFLVIVVLLSIIAFSLVGRQTPVVMVLSRILLIPVIAAVGYELLKLGRAAPQEPHRPRAAVPGPARPEDHDEAADRRHDRGRDRLDGVRARGRRRADPRGVVAVRSSPDGAGTDDRGRVSDLDAKLTEVAARYDAVQAELGRPEVLEDPSEIRRLGQELSQLEPVVEAFRRLEATRAELAGAREMRDTAEGDEELKAMAREEIDSLEADETRLIEELKVLLLPRDPNDDRDVILEIRAGAGGDEAALFAAELYRMYVRYSQRHRYTPELLSLNETGIDGIKEAIVQVHGDGAYSRLKFEGGVHRVQRIPATESSGRIHTSTATVVVLPEVDEVEITIDEERDLRIDVKRSSGPGGQSVNTTDSAVRITHLPSGLVVEIQDEKSQHKNKAKAMAVLRSRLYDLEQQKQRAADSAARRSMVGSGDRSDKVRTYNFPQDRVTDHRIGLTVHSLPSVMDGDLDHLIDALQMADQAERLSTLTEADGPGLTWRRPASCCTRAPIACAPPDPRRPASTPSSSSAFSVGVDRTAIVAHHDAPVGADAETRYRASIDRRAAGEPVAYIRGIKEFHGLAFVVDDRALIPRPETEALVDAAQDEVMRRLTATDRPAGAPPIRIADVGTGSGAVAIALVASLRRRRAHEEVLVLATDVSPDALDLARENAVGHAVADQVRFIEADLLPPVVADPFDIVLANLPYVRSDAMAGLPVATSFEPSLALDGGPDGLRVIERLLDRLPEALGAGRRRVPRDRRRPGRGDRGARRDRPAGWTCSVRPDLAGLPRVAVVGRPDAVGGRHRRWSVIIWACLTGPRACPRSRSARSPSTSTARSWATTWSSGRAREPRSAPRWPGTSPSRSSPAGWCRARCGSRRNWA